MAETALQVNSSQAPAKQAKSLGIPAMKQRRVMMQQLMNELFQKGLHYGTIPGVQGNMLLKPGMDMVCSTFGLVPHYEVQERNLDDNHREYTVKVQMSSISSGDQIVSTGIGVCTTMEKKYRYRWSGSGKNRVRVENEDIADVYNTVMKMAMKRALSAAVQTATGCADIFAADPSDLEGVNPETGEILDYDDPFTAPEKDKK